MPLAFHSRRVRSFLDYLFFLFYVFYFVLAHLFIFCFTQDLQLLLIEVRRGEGGYGLCAIDVAVIPLAFTPGAGACLWTDFNCFAFFS